MADLIAPGMELYAALIGFLLLLQIGTIGVLAWQLRSIAMLGSVQRLKEFSHTGQDAEEMVGEFRRLQKDNAVTLIDALISLWKSHQRLALEVQQLRAELNLPSTTPSTISPASEPAKKTAFAHPFDFQSVAPPSPPASTLEPFSEPAAGPGSPQPVATQGKTMASSARVSRLAEGDIAEIAELTARFERAKRSRRTLLAFVDECGGDLISQGKVADAGAMSFVVSVPVGDDSYALFPGPDLVTNFAENYYSERSMPADVKAAFAFDVDNTRELKLVRPGRGSIGPDGLLVVESTGIISGLSA